MTRCHLGVWCHDVGMIKLAIVLHKPTLRPLCWCIRFWIIFANCPLAMTQYQFLNAALLLQLFVAYDCFTDYSQPWNLFQSNGSSYSLLNFFFIVDTCRDSCMWWSRCCSKNLGQDAKFLECHGRDVGNQEQVEVIFEVSHAQVDEMYGTVWDYFGNIIIDRGVKVHSPS